MWIRLRGFRGEDRPINSKSKYQHGVFGRYLVLEGWFGKVTLRIGSWPLIPTIMLFFLIETLRSFPFRFPGISIVTSRSAIVCVHL